MQELKLKDVSYDYIVESVDLYKTIYVYVKRGGYKKLLNMIDILDGVKKTRWLFLTMIYGIFLICFYKDIYMLATVIFCEKFHIKSERTDSKLIKVYIYKETEGS